MSPYLANKRGKDDYVTLPTTAVRPARCTRLTSCSNLLHTAIGEAATSRYVTSSSATFRFCGATVENGFALWLNLT